MLKIIKAILGVLLIQVVYSNTTLAAGGESISGAELARMFSGKPGAKGGGACRVLFAGGAPSNSRSAELPIIEGVFTRKETTSYRYNREKVESDLSALVYGPMGKLKSYEPADKDPASVTFLKKGQSLAPGRIDGVHGAQGVLITIGAKKPNFKWHSRHRIGEGATNQENPLNPIITLGPRLASKLGFRLFERPDGEIELLFPQAKLVNYMVQQINQQLIKAGKEPITVRLNETMGDNGFVNSHDMMAVKSSPDQTGVVRRDFPFEDGSLAGERKPVTPHELAAHFSTMLLPRLLTERMDKIDQIIVDYFKFLKTETIRKIDPALHADYIKFVDQLRDFIYDRRFNEEDIGTGVLSLRLADMRAHNTSFVEALNGWRTFGQENQLGVSFIDPYIDFLSRPDFSIEQTLRIAIETGTNMRLPGSMYKPRDISEFTNGSPTKINEQAAQIFIQATQDFFAARKDSPNDGPLNRLGNMSITEMFLRSLDQRLADIEAAVDASPFIRELGLN